MSTPASEMQFVQAKLPRHDVKQVSMSAPFRWIAQGFGDFSQIPGLSLLYGFLFAGAVAAVYLLTTSAPWYALAYLTGLIVVGPFLASGLYVASRDLDEGKMPSISSSLRLLGQRRTYLALFSLMLALVMAAWFRFSAVLFAVKFNTLSPSIEAYTSLLSSADGWITLTYFVGVGFVLASIVFVVSAVAIPLILDRDADFITAIQTSYRAVTRNLPAMVVWAVMIVALTAVGVAAFFIGLAITFPVLGYATWHSYRAMVK